MAESYGKIAFTSSVKEQQTRFGSRSHYAKIEARDHGTEIGRAEAEFIGERDTFFLATVGETGFPYVQHRGGPKGFLKVLDAKTLAFADFRGNRQYISVGNLSTNDKAALFLMDYANRRRLKVYARIEIVEANEENELITALEEPGYGAQVERAMILHVEAFDWNCPQHITPRYTADEIRELNEPLYEQIARLETELEVVKQGLLKIKEQS